ESDRAAASRRRSAHKRRDQRDGLAAMTAIALKIGVQRKYGAIALKFAHPNETRIGQRHRHVTVTSHQRVNLVEMCIDVECDLECARRAKIDRFCRIVAASCEDKTCLR